MGSICRYMARHVVPNRLRLCFTCDVSDIEMAQEVVQPLSKMPTLMMLGIRLGLNAADHILYDLARKTVLQKTGSSVDSHAASLRYEELAQISWGIQI